MPYDNFSISLPGGYAQALDREAKRYGFNRSEFIRTLFEGYWTVAATETIKGLRKPDVDPETGVPDFFPETLPHYKAEANEWLQRYLRLVLRIVREAEERKKHAGSIDRDAVEIDHNLINDEGQGSLVH